MAQVAEIDDVGSRMHKSDDELANSRALFVPRVDVVSSCHVVFLHEKEPEFYEVRIRKEQRPGSGWDMILGHVGQRRQ